MIASREGRDTTEGEEEVVKGLFDHSEKEIITTFQGCRRY